MNLGTPGIIRSSGIVAPGKAGLGVYAAPLYGLLEALADGETGVTFGYTGLPADVTGINEALRTNWLVAGSTSNLPSKALIASASSTEIVPARSRLLTAANLRLKEAPPAVDLVVFDPESC